MRGIVVLLLLGLVGLGGCSDPLAPRPPDGPGVNGRMLALDDTGRDPTATGGGGILAVPAGALPELWRAVGTEPPDGLEHAAFATDQELVSRVGGELVAVDDDGHFRLTGSGPHLLCRLHADVTEVAGGQQARTSGCDLADLPRSGALTASYGEGGFHAEVE